MSGPKEKIFYNGRPTFENQVAMHKTLWLVTQRIFIASAILIGFSACGGTPIFSRPVYEDPAVFVRLDSPLIKRHSVGSPSNHPANFAVSDIHTLLRSVQVKHEIGLLNYYVLRQDPAPQPVFGEEEIRLLAPYVKAALAKAQPEETVAFFLNRPGEHDIPRITSGGLLVHGRQFALMLANFRTPMTVEGTRERAREHPLRTPTEPGFHFVAGPHQTILTTSNKQLLLPEPTSAPALLINHSALLGDSQHSGTSLETLPSPDVAPLAPSLEHKLRQLKAWHEEGLISEQEYQKKRGEILNSF